MKNPHKIGTREHWEFEQVRAFAACASIIWGPTRKEKPSRHAIRQGCRMRAALEARCVVIEGDAKP